MLIDKARELGIMIAESPEYIRLSCARRTVSDNEALTALLDEYSQKRARLVDCLSGGHGDSGDAVVLTNDIERLRDQLNESPIMSELAEAEASFAKILDLINSEINACIGASGCTHDCTSCGGCAH